MAYGLAATKKSAFARPVFLKKLSQATKDNFAADFMNSATENYILNEAGSRIYNTYRKQIARKGKELGVSVPSSWARKPFPVKEPEPEEGGEEEPAAEEAAEESAAE
tara:strand:- start:529 stop:849 length:321 start_codon:yes stop_codon:yes gene_type:complete